MPNGSFNSLQTMLFLRDYNNDSGFNGLKKQSIDQDEVSPLQDVTPYPEIRVTISKVANNSNDTNRFLYLNFNE